MINLKTAKALGLDPPAKILTLADDVIDKARLHFRLWHSATLSPPQVMSEIGVWTDMARKAGVVA